jgi:isopentenyl phosphate kinase
VEFSIVKLGGSVITSATFPDYFNYQNTSRLAEELSDSRKGTILVHGTGFVGKPPAIKYGYWRNGSISKDKLLLALRIKNNIRHLNQRVVTTFISASIPVLPFEIIPFFSETMNDLRNSDSYELLTNAIKNGLVPLFFGDIMPLSDGSFQVFSSDSIVHILGMTMRPDKIIFLTDVDGIYTNANAANDDFESKILETLSPRTLKFIQASETDVNDVSGGMLRKAELALEISSYCNSCFIASGLVPGTLVKLLRGIPVGTQVIGDDKG